MKALVVTFHREISEQIENDFMAALGILIADKIGKDYAEKACAHTWNGEELDKILIKQAAKQEKISPQGKRFYQYLQFVKSHLGSCDRSPQVFAKGFAKKLINEEGFQNIECLGILKNIRKYPECEDILRDERCEKLPAIVKDLWPIISFVSDVQVI